MREDRLDADHAGGNRPRTTDAEFEHLSWHDCHIWGLEFRAGEPDEKDWTSGLVIRLDFIVEWLCGIAGGADFRVAPAELIFHGVTDPWISIAWGSGFQAALHPGSIDRIEREPIQNQKVFLDRPYYRWRIALNWPAGGEIGLGAVGFTQTLLAEPTLTSRQHLTLSERSRVLRPWTK
jgi:hypothetical protein